MTTVVSCSLQQLQLFKKTSKEKLPSLKQYNPPAATGGTGNGIKGNSMSVLQCAHLAATVLPVLHTQRNPDVLSPM